MAFVKQRIFGLMLMVLAAFSLLSPTPSLAVNKNTLNVNALAALATLYTNEPKAKILGKKSAGILVFPNIVQSGLVVGGSGGFAGDGVLYNKKGKALGYYNSATHSVSHQSDTKTFSYAVFFMSDAAMKKFQKSKDWEIGTALNLALVDARIGKNLDTKTLKSEVYVLIFNQKGLTSSLGFKGQKITTIK